LRERKEGKLFCYQRKLKINELCNEKSEIDVGKNGRRKEKEHFSIMNVGTTLFFTF
jgi:hypothetical protein